MKKYQIAMYIRLSKEDEKDVGESNSITMQRILLQKYAATHFSEYDLCEYCDMKFANLIQSAAAAPPSFASFRSLAELRYIRHSLAKDKWNTTLSLSSLRVSYP